MAVATSTTCAPTPTRHGARATISLLQVLVLMGTVLVVLLGTLLGGRAYVSATVPASVVQPATVVTATTVDGARETTTSREV